MTMTNVYVVSAIKLHIFQLSKGGRREEKGEPWDRGVCATHECMGISMYAPVIS